MSLAYHYSFLDSDTKTSYKVVKGVLSIEGEELLFEYKLYDAAGKAISTLNKFSLTVDYLRHINFKKGLFKNKLVIESEKMVFLDPLPGSTQGTITLNIKRSDRNEALSFSNRLNLALSERKLKELGD